MGASLPLPPLPPPPPGPPPREQISGHLPLPPPPPRPLHQSAQPPRSGIGGNGRDKNLSELDEMSATEQNQVYFLLIRYCSGTFGEVIYLWFLILGPKVIHDLVNFSGLIHASPTTSSTRVAIEVRWHAC